MSKSQFVQSTCGSLVNVEGSIEAAMNIIEFQLTLCQMKMCLRALVGPRQCICQWQRICKSCEQCHQSVCLLTSVEAAFYGGIPSLMFSVKSLHEMTP